MGYVILAVFHIVIIGLAIFAGYYESNQASLDTLWTLLPGFPDFHPGNGNETVGGRGKIRQYRASSTLPIPPMAAVLKVSGRLLSSESPSP